MEQIIFTLLKIKKPQLMKKNILASLLVMVGLNTMAQERYFDEIFSNSDILVTKNIVYGINVNPLFNTSLMSPTYVGANAAQITQEKDSLLNWIATNPANIPTGFFYPYSLDTSTILKISRLKMDVYMPNISVDSETNRPVIIYVHTGNFLPPVINGSYGGSKEDSSAVELCMRWAKRGFVVVAPNYRHGWNPLAAGSAGLITRRATLLNAVYRAIHDLQYVVKGIRMEATNGSNTYAIDPAKVAIYGAGSGGYVALAYNTLDKQSETELAKFVFGGNSVIVPSIVGDINGSGGLVNLYQDNGQSTEIDICINAGGALGDISWLEAGDAPMITFHSAFDNFAPYDTGTVIVPTTGDDVVDVNGPNTFMPKANALNLNSAYAGSYPGDAYTDRARSFFGTEIANAPLINVNDPLEIPAEGMEGVFTFMVSDGAGGNEPNGTPWEWWSKTDLDVLVAGTNAQTGGSYNSDDINTNALLTNPNMSKASAMLYIDTIVGYMMPRLVKTMKLGDNWQSVGVNELNADGGSVSVYPNPAVEAVNIVSNESNASISSVEVYDLTGTRIFALQNIASSTLLIDLDGFASGLYLTQVSLENGKTSVVKFSVQ
jgi:hypothetical protein